GDADNPVPPEPEHMDALLDLMTAADPNVPPVLIAENNLWTLWSHLERRAFGMTMIPQGSTYQSAGGVTGPVYTHGAKPFVRLDSNMCRPQTVYGLDAQSFKRYMPNDLNVRWRTSQGGAA